MTATDGQLLERFRRHHDETAFAELVGRHGPMVLGVCRRVLQDRHAAEDAYQATFLVLVRNAASIRRPDALGSWLYGVAYRIAVKLQRSAARARIKPVAEVPEKEQLHGDPVTLVVWRELQPLLDEELQQLPEKYRAPLVLCELEGKSNAAAALELGCPASSLSSRLARGRELLHARLTRRGVALSSGLLFPLLAEQAQAALPSALVGPTVKAAALLALGQSATLEGVSPSAAAVAAEVARAMLLTRMKIAAAVVLLVGVLGTAVRMGIHAAGVAQPAKESAEAPPVAPPAPAAAPVEQPPPAPPQPDPVEELRQALRIPVPDASNPEQVQFRKANLEQHVRKLRQIGDLRRALVLQEWRDFDRELGPAIDGPVRKEVADRLRQALRGELKLADPGRRLVAIQLIHDIGVTIRDVDSPAPFARTFGTDLEELAGGQNPTTSAAAARALGAILPEPQPAAAVLGQLLRTGTPEQRRAAAEGLGGMVHTVRQLSQRLNGPATPETTPEAVLQVGQLVTPLAARGATDPDAEVQRLSLDTLRAEAATLRGLLTHLPDPLSFPPEGRKPSPEEQKFIESSCAQLETERQRLAPLLELLGKETPVVARALKSPAPATRLAACQALETLADTRARFRQRDAQIAPVIKKSGTFQPFADALRPGLQAAVPDLAALVGEGDVRVRLAALYALEALEQDAAPAVEAVVKAAKDDNPFIRWAVGRVLGLMAPLRAEQAVPVLARLLADENADVRMTAAAALERHGPAAKSAVDALGQAAVHPEGRTRQWAIQALGALGAEGAAAVPILSTALADPQTRVRRAAAQALGKLGPAARPAAAALRKALHDPEIEVRLAAADALLKVP